MKVSADDIAQLLASAPPRRVPGRVRRAARGGSAASWALGLFGLAFGGFGMLFVVIFFPWRFVEEGRLGAGGADVPAVILLVRETGMAINETQVVEYTFSYTSADGLPRNATCYTTGRRWQAGETVPALHLRDEPTVARLVGARRSESGGLAAAFVMIFPAIGFSLAGWSLLSWVRTRRVLIHGRLAEVDVRAVEPTGSAINYQAVYRVTLSPLPETGGQPLVVKRWATPEVNLLTQHALQRQPIYVLYDPARPKSLLFPEAMLGG